MKKTMCQTIDAIRMFAGSDDSANVAALVNAYVAAEFRRAAALNRAAKRLRMTAREIRYPNRNSR